MPDPQRYNFLTNEDLNGALKEGRIGDIILKPEEIEDIKILRSERTTREIKQTELDEANRQATKVRDEMFAEWFAGIARSAPELQSNQLAASKLIEGPNCNKTPEHDEVNAIGNASHDKDKAGQEAVRQSRTNEPDGQQKNDGAKQKPAPQAREELPEPKQKPAEPQQTPKRPEKPMQSDKGNHPVYRGR